MRAPDRKLTIAVFGNGGREDALAEAWARSPHVGRVVVSPGNMLIALKCAYGKVAVDPYCNLKSANSIVNAAVRNRADWADVAQDDALASGAVDWLQSRGIPAFGPGKWPARIEWDKFWQRRFADRHCISVPEWVPFESRDLVPAREYLAAIYETDPTHVVWVKAAGLCAGKGARKAASLAQALQRIEEMGMLGEAGATFLIEDGVDGVESSHFAVTDGTTFAHHFKTARDHKAAYDGEEGEMTGGMGAVAPAAPIGLSSWEGARFHLIDKVLVWLYLGGWPYVGILYAGAIADRWRRISIGIAPICLEHNARWGDPEAQVVVPGIETDYAEMVDAAMSGTLREVTITEDALYRVSVAVVARGYPGNTDAVRRKRIFGIEKVLKMPDIRVYGAGVIVEDNRFYVGGGRLFHIVGEGATLAQARDRVYAALDEIRDEDNSIYYRRDIGLLDLQTRGNYC